MPPSLQVKSLKEEEFTVSGLREGQPYQFRVAAENEVGVGEFAELPNVVPKSQHGQYTGTLQIDCKNAVIKLDRPKRLGSVLNFSSAGFPLEI